MKSLSILAAFLGGAVVGAAAEMEDLVDEIAAEVKE